MKTAYIQLFIIIFLLSCSKKKEVISPINIIIKDSLEIKKPNLKSTKNWLHLDIQLDSVPGISLRRAYDSILKDQKGNTIIVAVLDTELDINHIELKNKIWINKNEIPNNGKDDDGNGYIDDVHGWNFLGINKDKSLHFANSEIVRFLRNFKTDHQTNNKSSDTISTQHKRYINLEKDYQKRVESLKKDQEYGDFLVDNYPKSKALLKEIFPKENYTVKQLDSLDAIYSKTDKKKADLIFYMADFIRYDLSVSYIQNYKYTADGKRNKSYNLKYYDRDLLNDREENLSYTNYGNPSISSDLHISEHGTIVSGLIAADRDNQTGIKGIMKEVKIMPLKVSPIGGSVHDKDIALAIKYAVDHGAKVINMSFGKNLSKNKKWVEDAIKYAASKDVLIVSSAGNSNKNLDVVENYPNDQEFSKPEIASNFIKVGAIGWNPNKSFKSYFSNYGKSQVDLFAPGENIKTTKPFDSFKTDSGTSLSAAITSGVAGLIFSYYPELSASEVKRILMESGILCTIPVNIAPYGEKEKLVPFNELSKSGRVLNAYNALLLAERLTDNN